MQEPEPGSKALTAHCQHIAANHGEQPMGPGLACTAGTAQRLHAGSAAAGGWAGQMPELGRIETFC